MVWKICGIFLFFIIVIYLWNIGESFGSKLLLRIKNIREEIVWRKYCMFRYENIKWKLLKRWKGFKWKGYILLMIFLLIKFLCL